MRLVIQGSFDPITQKELEWIRKEQKKQGIRDVWLYVKEQGVLEKHLRQTLVQRAAAPYRHMHVTLHTDEKDCICHIPADLAEEEAMVRSGIIRLAARGIRNMLWKETAVLEASVHARCTAHRASHSLSVAKTAAYFARRFGLDEERMRIAGYVHDITKKQSDEENRRVMEVWYPQYLSESPKVWHSFTAEVFLRQEMCCYDSVIRNAVKHHTLGDGRSDHDRILYIADKIEPTRPYSIEEEWKIAERSLKEAAAFIYEETRQFIDTEETNV